MKRLWSDDDLVAHFTLLPQDRELLQNKTGATRLGFAVLLKCFQQERRFPAKYEIPFTVVRHIAEQIELNAEPCVQYPAEGRTVEYHRAQIREALGFRPITDQTQAILTWMDLHILPQERDPEALTTLFYTRCRDLHLEPPATKRLSRLIHSAIRTHEDAFCTATFERLTPSMRSALKALLQPPTQSEKVEIAEGDGEKTQETTGQALFYYLKAGPGGMQLKTVLDEIAKLRRLRAQGLHADLFSSVPPKILQRYRLRVAGEEAHELRRHPEPLRLTLLAIWSYLRVQEIPDNLIDLLNEMVQTVGSRAERKVERRLLKDFKRVAGKNALLFQLAAASLQTPVGKVREAVYPVADEQTLQDLVTEWNATGANYERQIQTTLRNSYSHHYRQMVPHILEALSFHSNNATHRPVLKALELLKQHMERRSRFFPLKTKVPLDDVVKSGDRDTVVEKDEKGRNRVHRIPYEVCVLKVLREKLRCREIWTEGGARFRNPDGESYKDLLYVHRRYITNDHLRNAITQVVNALLRVRHTDIWGEGTTACASDSKKFRSWDQNLMTKWHIRYRGPGVMIYWHVEKKSACIYSQFKRCSSEVAYMIQGVLRHNTEMNVEKNYVDTHGQSEIAFAFCALLRFELLPRLKGLHRQKLYRPETGKSGDYPHPQPALTRAIDWDLIRQQYDEMVKYATALRLGTTDAETILRRFTKNNIQHPTYKALTELGKARKTIFLCRYLRSEALRRKIQQGLNVMENWNSANIHYGKGGEFGSNSREDQERTMLCLHLLQNSMAYINTLMLQQVLSDSAWCNRLQAEDLRALTPLFYLPARASVRVVRPRYEHTSPD